MRLCIGIFAAAALGTSCTGPATWTPTSEELMEAVSAQLETGRENPLEVVDASLQNCQSGEIAGQPVQVCGFCVVTVDSRISGEPFGGGRGGTTLYVSRSNGSVALTRVLSTKQPNVQPAGGERGTFVAVSPTWQFDGKLDDRELPTDLLNAVGFKRRSGLATLNPLANASAMSQETRAQLHTETSRAAMRSLIGFCIKDSTAGPAAIAEGNDGPAEHNVTTDKPSPPAQQSSATSTQQAFPIDETTWRSFMELVATPIEPYTPTDEIDLDEGRPFPLPGLPWNRSYLAACRPDLNVPQYIVDDRERIDLCRLTNITYSGWGEDAVVIGKAIRPETVWYQFRLADGRIGYVDSLTTAVPLLGSGGLEALLNTSWKSNPRCFPTVDEWPAGTYVRASIRFRLGASQSEFEAPVLVGASQPLEPENTPAIYTKALDMVRSCVADGDQLRTRFPEAANEEIDLVLTP